MLLVLATANRHKIEELRAILASLGAVELRSLLDYPGYPETPETEETFEENARLKALACARYTGRLSLADDSGLVVDALQGRPGVYSARYAATSEERNRRMLEEMRGVPDGGRMARYVAAMALAWPDGRRIVRVGTCEGEIARSARGEGGFGYDPIFWLPERGCTMAELPAAEKNAISHRGRAIGAILPEIKAALRRGDFPRE